MCRRSCVLPGHKYQPPPQGMGPPAPLSDFGKSAFYFLRTVKRSGGSPRPTHRQAGGSDNTAGASGLQGSPRPTRRQAGGRKTKDPGGTRRGTDNSDTAANSTGQKRSPRAAPPGGGRAHRKAEGGDPATNSPARDHQGQTGRARKGTDHPRRGAGGEKARDHARGQQRARPRGAGERAQRPPERGTTPGDPRHSARSGQQTKGPNGVRNKRGATAASPAQRRGTGQGAGGLVPPRRTRPRRRTSHDQTKGESNRPQERGRPPAPGQKEAGRNSSGPGPALILII